ELLVDITQAVGCSTASRVRNDSSMVDRWSRRSRSAGSHVVVRRRASSAPTSRFPRRPKTRRCRVQRWRRHRCGMVSTTSRADVVHRIIRLLSEEGVLSLPDRTLKNVFQIGIVSADLDRTLRTWVEQYGVGPWDIYELDESQLHDTTIGEQPATY